MLRVTRPSGEELLVVPVEDALNVRTAQGTYDFFCVAGPSFVRY